MNCKLFRQNLLAAPNPDRVSDELDAHLGECARCREWQSRLVMIERSVPLVPVANPRPFAKAELIRRFENAARARGYHPRRDTSRFRMVAMAASVLIIAAGVWLIASRKGPSPVAVKPAQDALLAKLLERNVKLAQVKEAPERVAALGELADDLSGASRNMARVASGDDMNELAGLYAKVVQRLVPQAKNLPPAERKVTVAQLSDRLRAAGEAAERLSADVPTPSVAPLQTIAKAAREADRELRLLAGGDHS
jgi:hypothetical protein